MRAILFAMAKEIPPVFAGASPLPPECGMALYRLDGDTLLCVCGVGKVNAAMGAQMLIDRFGVTELWNAGVSGCFHDWPAGTLLSARACVQHDMDTFGDPPGLIPAVDRIELPCARWQEQADALNAAGLDCRVGVVASGDWFGRDFDRAAAIRDRFSAHLCDMEAGAAAQVCLRCGIPFRCVRVVSDHLFHPSQYEEYQANLPSAVSRLGEALELLLKE